MPLVWGLRLLGFPNASRVYGPTLTLHVCEAAASNQIPIGLYGGSEESLESFKNFLLDKYPQINISCAISPPFRSLTPEENSDYIDQIVASGARIIFVGIGCPKQEYWMSSNMGRFSGVMIGVGAAFDFHSGRVKQAPPALQQLGLEWAFRLAMEPRRLWKRYVYNNPRFLALFFVQWLASLFGLKVFRKHTALE